MKGWASIAKFLSQPLSIVQRWAGIGRYFTASPADLERWLTRRGELLGVAAFVIIGVALIALAKQSGERTSAVVAYRTREPTVTHEAEITKTGTRRLWLPVLVFLATVASPSQVTRSTVELESPDVNLILQRLEDIQQEDPALSRPYEVMREYKVFHGYDKRLTSEVTAQINFVPPDVKTYKIIQASGHSRGEKMVRELLDQETEWVKKGPRSQISRMNYDFVFLRRENFGDVPEYVFGIFPKRKDKSLLRGHIWVDASTFHIRRIGGVPAQSSSGWLKNIHITLQFGQLGSMWVPITFDAIATVRFLGQYTLAGLSIQSSESPISAPE